jgi:hypothetical protein
MYFLFLKVNKFSFTKIGIKMDNSYQKSETVSGRKTHLKEHMENDETF